MQKFINAVQDLNGNAVTGAFVTVYTDSNHTTKATIYSDNSLTVAANPLTTDSNGNFSFYAPNGRYYLQASKVGVLTQNFDDVLIFDPNDSSSTNTGAAYVTFVQSGTGAVAETVQQELRRTVRLEQFGADNTGTTSCSTALANAVTALGTNGGDILVGPGSFLFNSLVTIAHNTIRIIGQFGSTVFLNGSTNAGCIQFGDNVTQYQRCGIQDVIFASKSGVVGVAGQFGLKVIKQGKFVIQNVECTNSPAALYDGVLLTSLSQSTIQRLEAEGCLRDGIQLNSNTDIYWFGGRSDANGRFGYYQLDSQGMWFHTCTAYNNTTNGWRIDDGGNQNNKNNYYINCVGDTSGDNNWQVTQLANSILVNCWGSTQQAVSGTAAGFLFASNAVKAVTFIGCQALGNNGNGFYLFNNGSGCQNINFIGCTGGTSQSTNCGNGRGGAGWGFSFDSGTTNVKVIGGEATGNASAPFTSSGTGVEIDSVIGYTNEAVGTGTITSGNTSVTITHGLSVTPAATDIFITPTATTTSAPGLIWVDTLGSTTFKVNCASNPGASGLAFSWRAKKNL